MINAVDSRFRLIYTVADDDINLRDFLAVKQISKRTLTAIKFDGGQLLVNGVEQDVRHLLQRGDRVEVVFPPEAKSKGLKPEEGPLHVIYEDEAILIIDKRAEQSSMPSRDHRTGTVANYIAGKFEREGHPATVHIVTRLDFSTSGLMCIAKNRHVHHLLSNQLIAGQFHREYEAIAEGQIEQEQFTIERKIGRKSTSIIEREVRDDGKYARTDVRVLRIDSHEEGFYSVVRLILHTGRTHQIRVHLASIGYPLVGDDLYGGARTVIKRQALHCALLQFQHPITAKPLTFTSPLPKDMQQVLSLN